LSKEEDSPTTTIRNLKSGVLAEGRAIMRKVFLKVTLLGLALTLGFLGQVLAPPTSAKPPDPSVNKAGQAYLGSDSVQLADLRTNTAATQVADEPARYNLASVRGASSLQVIAGGETKGVICFYNVDGNRTTHIALEVVQAPGEWEVEIDPPLHEIEVKSGESTITVTENLHVEPSQLSPEPIQDVPTDMICLFVPNRGYALAKVATIIIHVPESEETVTEGNIRIAAVASWPGQTGSVTICQTRDFDFSVHVTMKN
jgi:hypothetical protein